MSKNLHSIFCDDVRLEVGNKLSFMGTYNGSMVVSGFPFDVPRLNVVLKATFDEDDVPTEPYRLVLLLNDREIAATEINVNSEQFATPAAPVIQGATDLRMRQSMQMIFTLNALRIDAPSILRTRAILGDEVIRGDGLYIVTAPDPT